MVLSLANVFPQFYAPLFMSEYVFAAFMFFFLSSECVCAVHGSFTSEYVYAVFMLFFSSECVYAVYGTFTSEYVYAVLCYFSRANVFALFFGTFTSEYVYAMFTPFMVPSRANMSSLFMLFFSSECAYAVYGTFTSEYVYYVFCFFFFKRMCLRWVICSFLLANMFSLFMAPYNISTLLWYFFISERICLCCYVELLPANVFCAVICYFCKRMWLRWFMEFFLKLLCLRGYMEFFCQRICSRCYAFLRLVLFMLLARSGFTRSVFIFCLSCVWLNQIGVAALSVKIEALEKQVSADSVDRTLVCVRQLAGRPVGLSGGTAIVAALESLADVSRSAGHVDFKRHEAILKQCRPLTHDPRLPAVVTKLLGDDESKKIAGQIQKFLKSDHLFSAPQVHGSPFPAPARAPDYLRQQGSGRGRYTPYGYGSYNNNYPSRGFNTTRCYNCRKTGHRIANCPALKRA